uniref:Uncharacterized protein n=1 Tax=Globodera rostochiensis TaxID=31243 RepID=A0A914I1E0_GLORO
MTLGLFASGLFDSRQRRTIRQRIFRQPFKHANDNDDDYWISTQLDKRNRMNFFRWVPGIVLGLWYCFCDMFNGCKKESVVGYNKSG